MILDFSILDTRATVHGETGTFICDLVVQILAYLTDAERKKNLEAQKMGIVAKKERGEWEEYGRPRLISRECFANEYQKVKKNQITEKELQEKLGISFSTFQRYKKELLLHKNTKKRTV